MLAQWRKNGSNPFWLVPSAQGVDSVEKVAEWFKARARIISCEAVNPKPRPAKARLPLAENFSAWWPIRNARQAAPAALIVPPNQEKIAANTIATTRSQNRFFFHVGLSAMK
jgi:hypothetical protein